MPIVGIDQPEILEIRSDLRLRKYDGNFAAALPWYQDSVVLLGSEGEGVQPYSLSNLEVMYTYLSGKGELYWIELDKGNGFTPIGDVTLWQEDLPIALGNDDVRGKGIGKAVLTALIERARSLGWQELHVENIFTYNEASRRLFTSCGFVECGKTETGNSYKLEL